MMITLTHRVLLWLQALALVICLGIAVWAGQKAGAMQGAITMVRDPGGVITVLTQGTIFTLFPSGGIEIARDLKDAGISGPFTEFTTGPGKTVQFVRTGSADRMRLTLVSAQLSPAPPDNALKDGGRVFYAPFDPDRPLLCQNHTLDNDGWRYAADADARRIVMLDRQGSVVQAIATMHAGNPVHTTPCKFSRYGNMLYVINRERNVEGSEIVVVDLDSGKVRPFLPAGIAIDPLDIIAMHDEVLIADNVTRNILSFYPEGVYRGYFGLPNLQYYFTEINGNYRASLLTMVCSLAAAVFIIIIAIAVRVRQAGGL
ncbi:MAG: hypothetical protein AABZ15_03705 [Nitrospirota bacterium]